MYRNVGLYKKSWSPTCQLYGQYVNACRILRNVFCDCCNQKYRILLQLIETAWNCKHRILLPVNMYVIIFYGSCVHVQRTWIENSFGWMCVVIMSHNASWPKPAENLLLWILRSLLGFIFIFVIAKSWRDWYGAKKNVNMSKTGQLHSLCSHCFV